MDCLVLGGFGYLGSRIIDHFSLKDVTITIGTHSSDYDEFPDLKIIKDYRKLNTKKLLDLTSKFDLVIDCSGISGSKIKSSGIDEIIKSNSLWPIKLAKACVKTNTRLIWFSTIHCENLMSDKTQSMRGNIYGISKRIAEESIFELSNWEKYITIIRLGNIIGSPGKIFNGKSDLFPLDITRQLVKDSKATIKSNPNNKIGYLAFSKLLNGELFEKLGFFSLYNIDKITLSSVAQTIKDSFFKFTKKESHIIYQGKILKNKNPYISKEMKQEIDLMVNYV